MSVFVESSSSKALVEDVVTLVKGGITETGTGLLVVRSPDTYRKWGASLKYSPALTKFEVKKNTFSQENKKEAGSSDTLSITLLEFLVLLFLVLTHDLLDHANLWSCALQHCCWPHRNESSQHAEGPGWVSAAVWLLPLRPLQTQRNPCPLWDLL